MKPYSLGQLAGILDGVRLEPADISVSTNRERKVLRKDSAKAPRPPLPTSTASSKEFAKYLLTKHPAGVRSEVFHLAVWALHDWGMDVEESKDILKGLPWVPKRYIGRLQQEIERCLSKPRPEASATEAAFQPPRPLNRQQAVALADCPRLKPAFVKMLKHYCHETGMEVTEKLTACCRILEHVRGREKQSVVMFPCGSGKSTWALVHVAVNASRRTPYLLVLQDRASVFRAAAQLKVLMPPGSVGIYAGWNSAECKSISGHDLKYTDCLRDDPKGACLKCSGKAGCHYHKSRSQLGRNVVLMTRESFLLLCERRQEFERHRIIVDEALLTFADREFSADELDVLHRIFNRFTPGKETAGLLGRLFPPLKFRAYGGMVRTPDDRVRWMDLSGAWDPAVSARIMRFVRAAGAGFREHEELVLRFLLFMRTAAACGASIAYLFDGGRLMVKKDRLDLRAFTTCAGLTVLDATAAVSLSEFAPDTRIWTCPDLESYALQGKASVYAVVGNATKRRRMKNSAAGLELLARHCADIFAGGPDMMLPFNRESPYDTYPGTPRFDLADVEKGIAGIAVGRGVVANIRKISRGLMRGTNDFRICTTAFFAASGLFTSVQDCALHACLRLKRDLPLSEVFGADGRPAMHHGRFKNDLVQDIFVRMAVGELHQGLYRTAVRDGRDVAVVIAVPDVGWLVPLRQLMRFEVVDAAHPNAQTVQQFKGLSELMNMEPGASIGKRQAAVTMGYSGDGAWKDHKERIYGLLELFFRMSQDGTALVRRDMLESAA